jgi:hypothetical protein
MPDFPFDKFTPDAPLDQDLESFSDFDSRLEQDPPQERDPISSCGRPYIEISLANLTTVAPEPGGAYKLVVDGRELTGTLDEKGSARIENETMTLEGRAIRVYYFPEPVDGASYRIELGPPAEVAEETEEPEDPLYLYDIPWEPLGQPEPNPDEDELEEDEP